MPEGVILGFDLNMIISLGIQWLNIALLTFVLYKLLYKPVRNFMNNRTERIRATLEEAEGERTAAEALRLEYEARIADIEAERDELLHSSHKKAVENSDKLLFAARSEAEEIQRRALEEIEQMRKREADDIKRSIIEISTLMASRFVEVSATDEDQERYISEAVSNLEIGR